MSRSHDEPFLRAVDVTYSYPGSPGKAVSGVNCQLARGEIVGLVGLAGSGKSTLGRLFKGFIEPDSGRFDVGDDSGKIHRLRSSPRIKTVGWTEAHPETAFFAETVREEVAFGPANHGLNGSDLRVSVERSLDLFGLDAEEYSERHPRALSGGEKRRVALASIVAVNYPYYIFDEPVSGLDDSGREFLERLLKKLRNERCGLMVMSHDLQFLVGVADRLLGIHNGKLQFDLPSANIDWDRLESEMKQGRLPEF